MTSASPRRWPSRRAVRGRWTRARRPSCSKNGCSCRYRGVMNPPSTTPDQVIADVATEPLDALLRQIINGYFVLTDGNGAVSKWSEPAELLFGRTAEEILGEGFFERLIGGELPPAGQAWRSFLDAGEPPRVPGTVSLTGRCSDGTDFPMEAVFVP